MEVVNEDKKIRPQDLFIILVCLFGAALSLNLFRLDLFRTINSLTSKPVGTVINKQNTIQRQQADRVLWDRLFRESSIYSGDLIRVANKSEVALNIVDNRIKLNENTLIRVQVIKGLPEIELFSGSLSFDDDFKSEGIILIINGERVKAGPGTIYFAEEGMAPRQIAYEETASGDERSTVTNAPGPVLFRPAMDYFWQVFFTNNKGIVSPPSSVRSFTVLGEASVLRQVFPPDNYTIATVLLPDILFTWKSNLAFEGRFQVSPSPDFSKLEIDEQVSGNSFQGCSLPSGDWYWRVSLENTGATQTEIATPSRRFNLIHSLPGPVLELPLSGSQVRARANNPVAFNWKPVGGAEYYRFSLYTLADRKNPVYERNFISDTKQSVLMDTFEEGVYYWSVQAFAPETSTATRQAGTLSTEQFTLQNTRPPLILESPDTGTVLPGLTALRQQTVFRWNFAEEVRRSRFVLSTNPDPFRGRPAIEIRNPGRTINLNRLGEGIWYWSVEVATFDGYTITGTPRQLRVLPIPLLPVARNRQPSGEHNIGVEELRERRHIFFSWSAVNGANAYILTLLQETDNERRQIVRTNPMNQTNWTLNDLSILNNGTFVWQVEAVNRNRNGVIEQRGQIGENTFLVDVPIPQVRTENPGVFYAK